MAMHFAVTNLLPFNHSINGKQLGNQPADGLVFYCSELNNQLISDTDDGGIYCETHKTVNTRSIHGMLLGCEEKANKV